MQARLELTREQILAFRRRAGGLDERAPKAAASLRRAAWAGLQDSMPRAALLSLHARVEGVDPSTWEHRSLAQLWGPRYSTYVVAKRDFALFSLGRLPDDPKGRLRAERTAERLHVQLDGARMTDREAARALGIGNSIRYAATTGTVAIRWDGARAPVIWSVPATAIDPADARRELLDATSMCSGRRPPTGSPAGPGSRPARRRPRSPRCTASCCRSERRSATSSCSRTMSAPCEPPPVSPQPRPSASCRAAIRTSSSRAPSGSCSFRDPTSDGASGRPVSGLARSSSTARSAAPGDARTTRFGSTPGLACRAGGATRSRPRRVRSRCPASTGISRSSGSREPRSALGPLAGRTRRCTMGAWPRRRRNRPSGAVRSAREEQHAARDAFQEAVMPPVHRALDASPGAVVAARRAWRSRSRERAYAGFRTEGQLSRAAAWRSGSPASTDWRSTTTPPPRGWLAQGGAASPRRRTGCRAGVARASPAPRAFETRRSRPSVPGGRSTSRSPMPTPISSYGARAAGALRGLARRRRRAVSLRLDEAMAAATSGEPDEPRDVRRTSAARLLLACERAGDTERPAQWSAVLESFVRSYDHVTLARLLPTCCADVFVASGTIDAAQAELEAALRELTAAGQRSRCVPPSTGSQRCGPRRVASTRLSSSSPGSRASRCRCRRASTLRHRSR